MPPAPRLAHLPHYRSGGGRACTCPCRSRARARRTLSCHRPWRRRPTRPPHVASVVSTPGVLELLRDVFVTTQGDPAGAGSRSVDLTASVDVMACRGRNGSAGLLVDRVLALPPAVLLHLDALAVIHLVLGGDVVAALARGALEGDVHPLLVGLACHRYNLPT